MNSTTWKIGVAIIFFILWLISMRAVSPDNPRFGELILFMGIGLILFIVGMVLGKKEGRW
jgi:hypothetical protein